MPIDLPLVFYYGHQTPTENPELYRALVQRMSAILDKRVSSCFGNTNLRVPSLSWPSDAPSHAVPARHNSLSSYGYNQGRKCARGRLSDTRAVPCRTMWMCNLRASSSTLWAL